MYKVREMDKSEVDLSQEKIDFINDAYQKELQHWKNMALESVSTENETRVIDLAPSRIFLICKAKNGKMAIIDEIICYLKSQHLTRNEEQRRKHTCL